eukprot:1195976-Prorocentrum_minimum.AAC.1
MWLWRRRSKRRTSLYWAREGSAPPVRAFTSSVSCRPNCSAHCASRPLAGRPPGPSCHLTQLVEKRSSCANNGEDALNTPEGAESLFQTRLLRTCSRALFIVLRGFKRVLFKRAPLILK